MTFSKRIGVSEILRYILCVYFSLYYAQPKRSFCLMAYQTLYDNGNRTTTQFEIKTAMQLLTPAMIKKWVEKNRLTEKRRMNACRCCV